MIFSLASTQISNIYWLISMAICLSYLSLVLPLKQSHESFASENMRDMKNATHSTGMCTGNLSQYEPKLHTIGYLHQHAKKQSHAKKIPATQHLLLSFSLLLHATCKNSRAQLERKKKTYTEVAVFPELCVVHYCIQKSPGSLNCELKLKLGFRLFK